MAKGRRGNSCPLEGAQTSASRAGFPSGRAPVTRLTIGGCPARAPLVSRKTTTFYRGKNHNRKSHLSLLSRLSDRRNAIGRCDYTGSGMNSNRCWRLAALEAERGCNTADFAYRLGVWAAMGSAPLHVPHTAVKRKFANDQGSVERLGQELAGGDQRINRNRQIVSEALFAIGSWCEVDGDALVGKKPAFLTAACTARCMPVGASAINRPKASIAAPRPLGAIPSRAARVASAGTNWIRCFGKR